jgi:hypothetical protein
LRAGDNARFPLRVPFFAFLDPLRVGRALAISNRAWVFMSLCLCALCLMPCVKEGLCIFP